MPDPTDAEIQNGADAIAHSWHVLSPTSRRHLAKLVLAAVLPDHDARVRADERQRMEAAGWRPPIRHGDPHMLAAAYGYELGQQDARADERRRVAEEIAQAIEAQADAYNERIALIAGVPPRGRDGMVSHGIRRAAAIARQHATTAEGDHHD